MPEPQRRRVRARDRASPKAQEKLLLLRENQSRHFFRRARDRQPGDTKAAVLRMVIARSSSRFDGSQYRTSALAPNPKAGQQRRAHDATVARRRTQFRNSTVAQDNSTQAACSMQQRRKNPKIGYFSASWRVHSSRAEACPDHDNPSWGIILEPQSH